MALLNKYLGQYQFSGGMPSPRRTAGPDTGGRGRDPKHDRFFRSMIALRGARTADRAINPTHRRLACITFACLSGMKRRWSMARSAAFGRPNTVWRTSPTGRGFWPSLSPA